MIARSSYSMGNARFVRRSPGLSFAPTSMAGSVLCRPNPVLERRSIGMLNLIRRIMKRIFCFADGIRGSNPLLPIRIFWRLAGFVLGRWLSVFSGCALLHCVTDYMRFWRRTGCAGSAFVKPAFCRTKLTRIGFSGERSVLTVLIVGGYGTFGGRIVELLEVEPRLTLIIAGRSLERARAFRDARGDTKATLAAAAFDRNGSIDGCLSSLRPDILVDASGPFQSYGDGGYRLIRACIARGINYLDLADGSDFVAGVSSFDAEAHAAGLFVLSGVSSFPVLTAAVVRLLANGLSHVDTISAGRHRSISVRRRWSECDSRYRGLCGATCGDQARG